MDYFLGVDIGSVSAKVALVNKEGAQLYLDTEKVTTGPRAAISHLISRLGQKYPLNEIAGAAISGSGRDAVPKDLNWTEYSSSLAIAAGVLSSHPDAKSIVQIGGQTSLVIELQEGLGKPWKAASNPLCAAGTGKFLEQQAYRLGISMEDLSRIAVEFDGAPPRIAARCSVFAKSDLIHLQQKGVPLGAMLRGLCGSIARMVASLKKGEFQTPAYFVGGVAANAAVSRALNETFSARNGAKVEVIVPENFLHVEALGCAVLARDSGKTSRVTLLSETDVKQRYFELPALDKNAARQDGWLAPGIEKPFNGFLGVDVGSTSTKAVILDETGKKVMAKTYLMTAGRPVDAVKDVFCNLLKDLGDKARISGVGVTGSGRYLVGSFIGADTVRNEITAQTRAAVDVDPDADIIEIGGQDSKLVIKRNGVVVEYQMNKACAAGTGSFIDEMADLLGVSVKNGDFARLAFNASCTIDLGTRCAAFMGQAVAAAQQQNQSIEVIAASLANSIARNYLSKVVGNRKLGDKIILTGAVFYNEAVVAAFQQALPGKTLLVPQHKEVSGAIGAALLAKEEISDRASKFKGFQKVVDNKYTLSTFTCKVCENNCAISRMEIPNEKPTFYGSRCDLFDSTLGTEKVETLFDEREKLLFREYHPEREAKGPVVGIPRALMIYDYAPLFVGFLNALGARALLSGKTSKHIMEESVELGYTDSCFPVKLLHGHTASLKDVDFVLYPSTIRMGLKDGDENQKYCCPLVQASPYIVRQVLGLEKKLLAPIIDFSRGDDMVVKSLAEAGVKMGFSKRQAREAAIAGIQSQRRFESDLVLQGQEVLQRIHDKNELGVVLFSRSYVSQDSGANMGIAEKLAQLGVTPIPLDFLPLNSVNVKEYSDRPYWISESKHIAGAAITAKDPSLYGLVLTNFGCGPNSFMLNIVEDIMGGKPLGQLEIDEHAAEAGIVTRLEAFVDTIRGFSRSGKSFQAPPQKDIYRGAPASVNTGKMLLIPPMAPGAQTLCAAMQAFGVRAMVLPDADESNIIYSSKVSSGKECLPYRVTLGGFMRFFYEKDKHGIDINDVEGFLASAYGPCRFGKYAVEEMKILKDLGFDFPIRTTVSNNGYHDLGLGTGFERLAWKGIVASDYLERLVWRSRPYEKVSGSADKLFDKYLAGVSDRIRGKLPFDDLLMKATDEFKSVIDPARPRNPRVGINGEIFLRTNRFSNCDLARVCEKAGLEVVTSGVGEWIKYISHRTVEDAVRERQVKKAIRGFIRKLVQDSDERSVTENFKSVLPDGEASIKEILSFSRHYLSSACGSEAVLSIGTGIEWMENPEFSGVISVMPHGCMPGGIVAAMSDKFSAEYGKPWINLTYDGFMENSNLTKINNFAEVIRFTSNKKA